MLRARTGFAAIGAMAAFTQFATIGSMPPTISIAVAAGSASDTPKPETPAKTDSPKPAAWPALRFGQLDDDADGTARHVVATMAVGNDPATNAEIAIELAAQLQEPVEGRRAIAHSIVVPTTFSLEDLMKQCGVKGSSLAGAYIALPQAVTSANDNYVFFTRAWSRISFATAVVECDAKDGGDKGPAVMWVSTVSRGLGNRNSVSLSPLAALASIYAVLTPSKTATTVTTRAFPTTTPLAAGGETTQTQTTNTTTTNPTAANGVGTTLLGLFGSQSANVGAVANISAQASQAIRGGVIALSLHIHAVCKAVAVHQTPMPTGSTVPISNSGGGPAAPIGELVGDQLPARNPAFCKW